MKSNQINVKPWEDRQLGAEAEFVAVADESHEIALNQSLKLQLNASGNAALEADSNNTADLAASDDHE